MHAVKPSSLHGGRGFELWCSCLSLRPQTFLRLCLLLSHWDTLASWTTLQEGKHADDKSWSHFQWGCAHFSRDETPVGQSEDQPYGNPATYFAWIQMLEPAIRARRAVAQNLAAVQTHIPSVCLKHVSDKRWGNYFFLLIKCLQFLW